MRRDLADRAQRRAETAARVRLVHLRHLERAEIDGAEQARRKRLQRPLDAELAHVVEYALDAERGAEACRRDVVGLRQRRAQRRCAVELPVVVRRLPVLRTVALPDERAVVERRDERVARGFAQRGEVDGRLQQRSHRARRVDRAVETAVARVAPANQRLYFARLGVGDHDRAFEPRLAEAFLAVELRQAPGEGTLGGALHARVERSEDAQAFGAQVGFVVVAPQLTGHELHEGRVGRSAHRRLRVDPQRSGARLCVLLERDEALVSGLAQHQVAPLERALRVAVRVVDRRALHHADQQRAVGQRELLDRLAEIEQRGEPDAVDSAVPVLAEIDLVEIGLEDLVLVVVQLEAPQRALGR